MITLKKTDNGIQLIPDPDRIEDIQECDSIEEALESNLCNGWQIVAPEEVGGLTNGTIVSDDCERDDHGTLINVGRVYWDANYQVADTLEEMKNGNTVTWMAAD